VGDKNTLVLHGNSERILTNRQFRELADVPPEVEWFANLENPNTRRAYQIDLRGFPTWSLNSLPSECTQALAIRVQNPLLHLLSCTFVVRQQ